MKAFFRLWKDIDNVNVSEDQWIKISLIENWRDLYKAGQARVYPLGTRDRKVVDEAFDKLHQQDRLKWTTQVIFFSFPCFVIWKNTSDGSKGRAIVDIRALNKIIISDAYFVSVQTEILALIMHVTHISIIDTATFFYQ